MTLLALLVVAYARRSQLIWTGLQAGAFTVGFIAGWKLMERS
jgi:hypothetical protein